MNPDLWGRRLADFLRAGLINEGFEVTEPIAEDWGWAMKIKSETPYLWVGCGHYQEHADGYLCFIEPNAPPAWRLFGKMKMTRRIAELQRSVDRILAEEAGIRAK
ncbi:hypothetical protein HDF16_002819 [Granulicella aggregans]|uniref:Uncharacterized protein n=1 Tax=Granulicella aggregans TaxID=474949 RepID=A0A7W8E3L4_9BACT|nr:hypothetical protein [Granulicella aggregans]MBB5058113.1 hypothetical protein [Granulicella aggregans]